MPLTRQQRENVLSRLRQGDPIFRIATDLGHSPHTVRRIRDTYLRAREAGEPESGHLAQHQDDLARTASTLALNAEALLKHRESNVRNLGDIVDGLSIWMKDTSDLAPEHWHIPKAKADPYLAQCLLAHWNEQFPGLRLDDWKEVTLANVTPRMVANLKLLAHSKVFKVTRSCPVCAMIVGEANSPRSRP